MARSNNNYIGTIVKQYGDQWIATQRPEDIQRSAKRIFRDMVKGTVDFQQYGHFFLDAKFLDNLIVVAYNECESNELYCVISNYYKEQLPAVPGVSMHLNHHQVLLYVYTVIYQKLSAVKETENIGWLVDIPSMLYPYRNHLLN